MSGRITELLVSTGAFIGRRNGFSPAGFFRYADELPVDGFEFMMYRAWYEEIDRLLPRFLGGERRYPVFHIEKTVGELFSSGDEADRAQAYRLFAENCRIAREVGADCLVLHLWNGLPSDRLFGRHLREVGELCRRARAEGLTLTLENVVCASLDPATRLHQIAALFPEARFTYDTKMAAFHDRMRAFDSPMLRPLWERERIAHIHFNDFGGVCGDFSDLRVLQIGNGWIDFPPFVHYLAAVGYRGRVTLECTAMRQDGTSEISGLLGSLRRVRELFCREGLL